MRFIPDIPLTKRQLGWLFVVTGGVVALISLGVDLVGVGRFSGLGPAQQQALAGGAVLFLFGLTLLPLGDRSA
jgi:hypothetical protein